MGEVQKIFLQSNTDSDNIKSQPLPSSKNNALQKYPNFLSNLPKLTQGKAVWNKNQINSFGTLI